MEKLIKGTYVTLWENTGEIETFCTYNSVKNEVFDVGSTDMYDDDDCLIKEFIRLEDGTEIDSFKMDGDTFLNGERMDNDSVEKTKEFIKCLDEFKKSFDNLLTVWLSVDTEIVDEFIHLEYPFKDSFNEINVNDWVRRFKTETKKIIY